jgi:hypothetical protein
MPGRYRERVSLSELTQMGLYRTWFNNSIFFQYAATVYSNQQAERCFDATHHGPPYTETGPFTLVKAVYPFDLIQGKGTYIGTDYRPDFNMYSDYYGGFVPNGFGSFTIPSSHMVGAGLEGNPYGPDWGSAEPYSTAARNRFKPKIAKAGLGQAIAEIRDLLPMLKSSAKGFAQVWKAAGGHPELFAPKNVADHFINHEFGWLPFINDIRQVSDVYQNTRKYVNALRRANGKWVKRGGTVLTDGGVSAVERYDGVGLVLPSLPPSYYSADAIATGNYVTSHAFTQSFDKVWYEGRFRQYIQSLGEEDSNYHKIINRVHLYGARISPSLIWKVTPWTWAVDWFSNAGDIISNAEDESFGLASLYSCTMRHRVHRVVNESVIHLKDGDVACSWSQEIDSKTRHGGGPFGFALEGSDLTPTQTAILLALGISRS